MADTSHRVDVELSERGVPSGLSPRDTPKGYERKRACMQLLCRRPLSVGLLVILSIGLLCGGILATDPMRRFCVEEGQCLTPASYLTMMITVVVLLGLCNDAPPDLTLLAATVLLSVLPGPMEGSTRWRTLISPRQAWEGFSSPSILAIGGLFVFARAIEETRAVEIVVRPLLGKPRSHVRAVLRLCVPTAVFSAFLNNTPIVAMLISVTEAWCARASLSPSVLLMPLSFASILGGTTTLIGTSTNLVLNAQIETDPAAPCEPFGFFSMSLVGIPAAAAGVLSLALIAPRMLGGGGSAVDPAGTASSEGLEADFRGPERAYVLEVVIEPSCELLGERLGAFSRLAPGGGGSRPQTVRLDLPSEQQKKTDGAPEDAADFTTPMALLSSSCTLIKALRVVRGGATLWNSKWDGPADTIEIEEGDRIWLSIDALAVPLLRRTRGVRALAEDASEALGTKRRRRCLHEACLASSSPLVGLDLRAAAAHPLLDHTALWGRRFGHIGGNPTGLRSSVGGGSLLRTAFDPSSSAAAPTAAASASGQRNSNGDSAAADDVELAPLRTGDTLLLEADERFSEDRRADTHYALLSIVPSSMPPRVTSRKDGMRLYASLSCLAILLALSATELVALLPLSLILSSFLVAIKCITPQQAWRAINYRVLLTTCCSFGLGSALSNTHVSAVIAAGLAAVGSKGGPLLYLFAIFFLASLLSCVVSNSATVVLLYHVVRSVRVPGIVPAQPLLALMIGGSCAFATPIGYQTNLMVLTRGNYRFSDFGGLGGLLTVVVGATACSILYALPASMLPATTTAVPGNHTMAITGPMS